MSWKIGGRRVGVWLAALSLAVACGDAIDEPPNAEDGGAGAGGEPSGQAGEPAEAGQAGAKPGQAGATGEAGEAGRGGASGAGGAGNEGGLVECGGCQPLTFALRCRSGNVEVPSASHPFTAEEACRAVQQSHGEGGAGGAGGAHEAASQGGAAGAGDVCESYADPPRINYVDGGCRAWEDEDRAGECVVQGECCVVVELRYCGR